DGSLELVAEVDERSAMAIVGDDTVPDKIVIVYEEKVEDEELIPDDRVSRVHEFDIKEVMKELKRLERKKHSKPQH
ncbi:MAG: hypothetical protein QXQ90_01055, partial [Desulfurococcaceae archaeon]